MSVLVADRAAQHEKLVHLAEAFQAVARTEARDSIQFEQKINAFLDSILSIKSRLKSAAGETSSLAERLSAVSWFTALDDEATQTLRLLLERGHRLTGSMLRNYATASRHFHQHGIDKAELRAYKEATDGLKEVVVDLENRFFVFPQDPDLQDLARQFADL